MTDEIITKTIIYDPHKQKMQDQMTEFLHKMFMRDGRYTLNEVGYLHMTTLTVANGNVELYIYFHPSLACYYKNNQTTETRIRDAFDILSGYLFVGDIRDVISRDQAIVPAFKIRKDDLDKDALYVRSDDKYVNTQVLRIKCNLLLTFAAINNINLKDPNYKLSYNKVGSLDDKKSQYIETENGMAEHPILAKCQYTADDQYAGYDPELAIPYLTTMAKVLQDINTKYKKLKNETNNEPHEKKRNKKEPSHKGYNRYG